MTLIDPSFAPQTEGNDEMPRVSMAFQSNASRKSSKPRSFLKRYPFAGMYKGYSVGELRMLRLQKQGFVTLPENAELKVGLVSKMPSESSISVRTERRFEEFEELVQADWKQFMKLSLLASFAILAILVSKILNWYDALRQLNDWRLDLYTLGNFVIYLI